MEIVFEPITECVVKRNCFLRLNIKTKKSISMIQAISQPNSPDRFIRVIFSSKDDENIKLRLSLKNTTEDKQTYTFSIASVTNNPGVKYVQDEFNISQWILTIKFLQASRRAMRKFVLESTSTKSLAKICSESFIIKSNHNTTQQLASGIKRKLECDTPDSDAKDVSCKKQAVMNSDLDLLCQVALGCTN